MENINHIIVSYILESIFFNSQAYIRKYLVCFLSLCEYAEAPRYQLITETRAHICTMYIFCQSGCIRRRTYQIRVRWYVLCIQSIIGHKIVLLHKAILGMSCSYIKSGISIIKVACIAWGILAKGFRSNLAIFLPQKP